MGGIIILLLLLVSLIAFIYFVVVTAKGWGALHVTMLCFLFIECWCFLVFAAGVHSIRVKSVENLEKQQDRAERAAQNTQDLLWGTNFQADINNLEAVVVAQNELRRLAGDRGRVWRGVEFITAKAGGFDLELTSGPAPTVDELAGDAPAPAAPATPSSKSLPVGLVVYAFGEEVEQDTGLRKPKIYFGEHTVTKSQDGAVTLKPTIPLTPLQQQGTRDAAITSWTLYESLPLDSHRAFRASGSKEAEDQIFGRMDEPTITALFASVPETDNRRASLISSYLHDGQPATDEDPEDAIWLQLNMLKNKDFNVDGKAVNIAIGSFHDTLGRAIDARIMLKDPEAKGNVKIGPDIKDELIIFKKSTATDEMLDPAAAEAELMQRVYVRPLVDFELAFAAHDVRMNDVAERIEKYKRETSRLVQSTTDLQAIISSEQLEYGKLEEDLGGYRRETTVLDERVKTSEDAVAALENELTTLFNLIQSQP